MAFRLIWTLVFISSVVCYEKDNNLREYLQKTKAHMTESNTNVFNYMVAILKKSKFLSSGVLINKNWVMTGADALYSIKDTFRLLRIRLGSTNYKKDGVLLSAKRYSIHPNFDDTGPKFDLALIRLSASAETTNYINPIRVETKKNEVYATHFIVTVWKAMSKVDLKKKYPPLRAFDINVHHGKKTLQVLHMHPQESATCARFLAGQGVNDTDDIICLDTGTESRPCEREAGAPMVLNRVLWGIVSSWAPENCTDNPGPLTVNLLTAPSTQDWLMSNIYENDDNVYYDQYNDYYLDND